MVAAGEFRPRSMSGTLMLRNISCPPDPAHALEYGNVAVSQRTQMNSLDWLVGHRLLAVIRQDYQWVFQFADDAHITAACLWRLIEDGRIRTTSEDDGRQFGLPGPVVAEDRVNGSVKGKSVTSVVLREGTLDLELRFGPSHRIQIIPNSSGYESWNASEGERQFIAVGGGELATF